VNVIPRYNQKTPGVDERRNQKRRKYLYDISRYHPTDRETDYRTTVLVFYRLWTHPDLHRDFHPYHLTLESQDLLLQIDIKENSLETGNT